MNKHRKLKNLLVRPEQQINLVMGVVASLILVSAFFFLAFRINVLWILTQSHYTEEQAADLLAEPFTKFVLAFLCALVVTTVTAGLMLTHRIFGPIVPILRHVRSLRDGNYASRVHLRRGDQLHEIASALNELAEVLERGESRARRGKSNREAGFSLIEVTVVGGLMALVALGAASIQRIGVMGQKTLLAQDDSRTLTDDLTSLFANPDACRNTFVNLNPKAPGGTAVAQVKNAAGEVRYEVSKVYGNRAVALSDIRIGGGVSPAEVDAKSKIAKYVDGATDANGNPTGTAFVKVDWLQTGSWGNRGNGPGTLSRYLLVDVVLNPATGRISACTAQLGTRTVASSGEGIGNFVPLWTNTTNLGNSALYQGPTGNVGIGTQAPGQKLEVAGNVQATAFLYTSDARLKRDVRTLDGGLARRLRGVRFHWIRDGRPEIGFLAQEVEEVAPELVTTNADGLKAVKYGNVTALLVEAIKEQDEELASLRREISELRRELRASSGKRR